MKIHDAPMHELRLSIDGDISPAVEAKRARELKRPAPS